MRTPVFSGEKLLAVLRSYPKAHSYIVGFSGGADSTALLHALSNLQDQLETPVSAVHINHGIHAHSNTWQAFCEQFCQRYQTKLVCLNIELSHQSGKGLEAEARHLRYEAMSTLLKNGATLLTAHHADDQAETLLLNLMRGSGVDGLSAMPEHRILGNGFLQRPLLCFENNALIKYLKKHKIEWIDDPSNQYLNHDRNFVRHELIPVLERRWQNVNKRLLLTREAMADARVLLERLADEYLDLHLQYLYLLQVTPELVDDRQLLKLVIRRWVLKSGVTSIPADRMRSFYQQLKDTDSSKHVELAWDDWKIRYYRRKLWLLRKKVISTCPDIVWTEQDGEIDLGPDVGLVALRTIESTDSDALPDVSHSASLGTLSVTTRRNTHLSRIKIGGHHKSLKKLFQASGIPPWLRNSIPLIRSGDELVGIGDWCFSDSFSSWMRHHGIELKWQPRHPLLQVIRNQQHTRQS